MARYKLMSFLPDGNGILEVGGQRKNTKKEIEQWIEDNISACGLDWRVGYNIKFRNYATVYSWRWIKNGLEVRV